VTWEKGQSGNPGGRRKKDPEVRTAEELAREATPLAIKTLIDIAENGDTSAAKVAASNSLLARGWGSPKQSVEHSGKLGIVDMLQQISEQHGDTDHASQDEQRSH